MGLLKTLWRGLRKEKIKPTFVVGDLVRLRHENPHKGVLSADKVYPVLGIIRSNYPDYFIRLPCDNHTYGWFQGHLFMPFDYPLHKGTIDRWSKRHHELHQKQAKRYRDRQKAKAERLQAMVEAAAEYEEILQTQEIADGFDRS